MRSHRPLVLALSTWLVLVPGTTGAQSLNPQDMADAMQAMRHMMKWWNTWNTANDWAGQAFGGDPWGASLPWTSGMPWTGSMPGSGSMPWTGSMPGFGSMPWSGAGPAAGSMPWGRSLPWQGWEAGPWSQAMPQAPSRGGGQPSGDRPQAPSVLEGVWQGAAGDVLTVHGHRFRIEAGQPQVGYGTFMLHGNRLIAYLPQTDSTRLYEYEVRGDYLALRDESGQMLLFRRLPQGPRGVPPP